MLYVSKCKEKYKYACFAVYFRAILESHHVALSFKLTCKDDKINIFKNLDRYVHISLC